MAARRTQSAASARHHHPGRSPRRRHRGRPPTADAPRLDRRARIVAGIFPIVKVDKKVVSIAREVYEMLKNEWNVVYDDGGAVGRRYARADEQGIPFCITIDFETIEKDDSVFSSSSTWIITFQLPRFASLSIPI